MSVRYVKDLWDKDGEVHVMSPIGDGEFTYCDRDFTVEIEGGMDDSFTGVECSGPATCSECKRYIDEIRDSLKGIRWNLHG